MVPAGPGHPSSAVDACFCRFGPPYGRAQGIDFRPDRSHFGAKGGPRLAAYLVSHVPAIGALARKAHDDRGHWR